MSAALTCDRCLDGRHVRCADKVACACSCRTLSKPSSAVAGAVVRSPRPSRPRPAGVRKGGRPRKWADDRERKREHMRTRRPDGDRARAIAELKADPTGRNWSRTTRRIFAAEMARIGGAS